MGQVLLPVANDTQHSRADIKTSSHDENCTHHSYTARITHAPLVGQGIMALNVSPAGACQAKRGLKCIAVGRLYRAIATFRCSIESHAYLSVQSST